MISRTEINSENVGNRKKVQSSDKILKSSLLFPTLLKNPQHENNFYSYCMIHTVLLLSFTIMMIISKKSSINTNLFHWSYKILNIFITV